MHRSHSYSTICGVHCTKRCCVYRASVSCQPTETQRQFNVLLSPKHILRTGEIPILSREKTLNQCPSGGFGLGFVTSRTLSIESSLNSFYNVLGIMVDSWPVELSRQFFFCLHDTIGMPWWSVIISGTVLFRLALLPLTVLSLQSQAKLTTISPQIRNMSAQIAGDVAADGLYRRVKPNAVKKETRLQITQMKRDLYVKHNCSPMKPFCIVYVQIPVIVTCGLALRSYTGRLGPLADNYFQPEMCLEGLAWFSNLTIADPYFILPTIGFLCTFCGLEYSMLLRKVNQNQVNWGVAVVPETKVQKGLNYLTRFGQGVVTVIFPFLCFAPSSITLYFSTMSVWSLTQMLALNTPSVKRALGIQKSKLDSPTPHRDVLNAFQAKYLRHKKESP
ncbi:cytochrome c oxidase assembly protein COX18, mitochondrial-like [Pecten maximus]|uniref:cytochrome c oxidase assembly protein COX18, mitochondrial-like n=1 Tax=Pecten maximus TaxID=6579 RepID=UPI001458613C|nr:cytochrome c oxidase assembly protein COX18, mitochondrial-like [Pecten maximus]